MKSKFIILLLLFTTTYASWAYDFEIDGVYYTITGNTTVEVTNDGPGSYADIIVIPSTVENEKEYTVNAIGKSAFHGCEDLTSVTIPKSVTIIKEYAFGNCINLTAVRIPDSVIAIGAYAFNSCTGLEIVEIPSSINTLGEGAFGNCTSLKYVLMDKPATSIVKNAFDECPIESFKLALEKEDFPLHIYYDTKDNEIKASIPSNKMSFEIISRSEYEKNRSLANDFILCDTFSIQKKNGTLKLPCKNKEVVLKDVEGGDSDNISDFSYIGQIEFLNVYVVYGVFSESTAYSLYEKSTGELLHSFNGYPVISPDKKHIVDIYPNWQNETTDLSLFKISEQKQIEEAASYACLKWSTYDYDDDNCYFWGADNNLYVKTTNMYFELMDLANFDFDQNSAIQYIRIKINQ